MRVLQTYEIEVVNGAALKNNANHETLGNLGKTFFKCLDATLNLFGQSGFYFSATDSHAFFTGIGYFFEGNTGLGASNILTGAGGIIKALTDFQTPAKKAA